MIRSLVTNLIAGARLAVCLPLRADAFRSGIDAAFVLLLVALAVAGAASRLTSSGDVYFDGYSFHPNAFGGFGAMIPEEASGGGYG